MLEQDETKESEVAISSTVRCVNLGISGLVFLSTQYMLVALDLPDNAKQIFLTISGKKNPNQNQNQMKRINHMNF